MNNKVLLLDFDGVILKSPNSNKIIANKANRFVKNFVNTSNKNASIINKYLYKTFGHTAIGLQKLGYKTSIDEYNKFVYNDINYKLLFKNLKKDYNQDINDITNTIYYCNNNNIRMAIFSNSPSIWYSTALQYMDIDPTLFDHIYMNNTIKPDPKLFKSIEEKYRNYDKFYFVDDQFVNFSNTLLNNKWTNIMFDQYNIELPNYINLKIIKNLTQINDIIEDNLIWNTIN
jgi:FMN phosphatase YigB (HAD superfamily)